MEMDDSKETRICLSVDYATNCGIYVDLCNAALHLAATESMFRVREGQLGRLAAM